MAADVMGVAGAIGLVCANAGISDSSNNAPQSGNVLIIAPTLAGSRFTSVALHAIIYYRVYYFHS
ncbi:MAG: hypothetical protein WA702_08595 [Bradyrhizobium sp.]|uniref:hypothetical protein n=1 Tax=Bradyrhizobium sp. TaxID=376 RepID=UPI003C7AE004